MSLSSQTDSLPVKISNLPDKCPITGAYLQACTYVHTHNLYINKYVFSNPRSNETIQDDKIVSNEGVKEGKKKT